MRLSIVIPAYNEAARLAGTLQRLLEWRKKDMQIVVVDDGSADATAEIASSFADRSVCVISLPVNRGKGAAVRAGAALTNGDIAVLYDADAAAPPDQIDVLLQHYDPQNAPVVIGSRVLNRAIDGMLLHRKIAGKIFHILCLPLLPGIADASCGCKIFRTDILKKICAKQQLDRYAFDIELLLLARSYGANIVEVPVRWTAMPHSKVMVLRDGPEMFARVLSLYRRFWRRNESAGT